uniref:Uncharacterized protein n=1 Tax=Heterorhabditis bacteriophora TaxID=37862 RepID=A0A1I7WJD3_HETBA
MEIKLKFEKKRLKPLQPPNNWPFIAFFNMSQFHYYHSTTISISVQFDFKKFKSTKQNTLLYLKTLGIGEFTLKKDIRLYLFYIS